MASGTVSENIGKLSNGTVLFVEWKIQDFLSLPLEVGNCIQSPSFHFGGEKFYFEAYPNGETDSGTAGYVDIFIIQQHSTSSTFRVNYHIGISSRDGSVYKSLRSEHDFGGEEGWGASGLVELSEICNNVGELAPNGVVTFFCYLQMNSGGTSDASTQTALPQDTNKLAKNLKDLLLNKEECDITLKVKNQELQAHKAILVARSSVFSSMFRHEMAEKLSGAVNIPDCDPDAFQLFLIYLYTGTVEGLSSSNVFNMYAIANKYDAVELKASCTEYMKTALSVETVCDVVALSLLHNESDLLEWATNFFTKHFKDVIVTFKWRQFLEENPAAANDLLIEISKHYSPPE